MKLPNLDKTVIDREKIVEYLLNAVHPDNGGKSAFFESLGFNRDNWHALATSLRQLAETTEITKIMESTHGVKYIIDGYIESSNGKKAMVRMI
ncbi:MAG: hypothetical protein M1470_09280 [Bacteroidetes bacterium]|nr:hypothetical protein [Bacteroidota bacterium]MCL5737855.1 hypothetical protein [Bacteroidota bacterium]